jgi:hypothetical protein
MSANFSEELQVMYRDILLQQHNLAYSSMIAAFSTAVDNPMMPHSSVYTLDTDIPREDIECDVEIIVVKNFRDGLKKLKTNLNGPHGKKLGFRKVVEIACTRPAYPSSPSTSFVKRSRLSTASPSTSTQDGNQSKKPRVPDDTATTFDDSNASSHDGSLQIALYDSHATQNVAKNDEICDNSEMRNSSKLTAESYKPSKLRVERIRNISKTKPKFSVENLDLTYHSNMARNFPGSENRTNDQQAKREKGTLAARVSRTKHKAYEQMLEKQSINATKANITAKRQLACLRVYANALMEANGSEAVDFNELWEKYMKDILCASSE